MMVMVMTLVMAVVTMMMFEVMVTMMIIHKGSLQLLMAIWQEPTTFGVKMDIWVSILFGKGVRENKTGSKIVSRYDSFAQPVLSDQAYQGPRDSLIMVIYDNPSSCDKVL